MAGTRGRRPAGSGTREAILAAASRAFAEQGYPRTTLRGIARDAGVDTRLVTHYFGSKQDLFIAVVELPFDPEQVMPAAPRPGPRGVGVRLAALRRRHARDARGAPHDDRAAAGRRLRGGGRRRGCATCSWSGCSARSPTTSAATSPSCGPR